MSTTLEKSTIGNQFADLFRDSRIIDLSVDIDGRLPCTVPTDQFFAKTPSSKYEIQGFVSNILVISDHTGTHCDAPAHYIPGGKTVESLDLGACMGPCDVIDVTALSRDSRPGKSPIIQVSDIKRWEDRYGPIAPGDVVLLYTGWSDAKYKPLPEGYAFDQSHPAPNGQTIEYLVEKKVRHVGIDGVGIGLVQNDAEPHVAGLKHGVIFTEKLINLGALPARGAFFIFLPLKVPGATGGLGRAIALV